MRGNAADQQILHHAATVFADDDQVAGPLDLLLTDRQRRIGMHQARRPIGRRKAGMLAKDTRAFFQEAVIDHHHEEEGDLFPAVLAASSPGAEYDKVQRIVNRLTAEHREIEAIWRELEPAVHQLAKRKSATIDGVAVASLVQKYQAHARFEEETFLPLSALILGRRDGKMASLGLALHMRHVLRAAKRGLRRS